MTDSDVMVAVPTVQEPRWLTRPSEVAGAGLDSRDGLPRRRTAAARVLDPMNRRRRWGVILAGGDGVRLQRLTRFICGDDRPKQFCRLFGSESLLEQTRKRAERSIAGEQILFALTRKHREYYSEQLAGLEAQCIVQPENKGTAPPILYTLLSIAHTDPEALVTILPSDHHYENESAFTDALENSFEVADERPGSVVLLGARANHPETEYGWIKMGYAAGSRRGDLYRVHDFVEKPSMEVASALMAEGAAWNTFVMTGHVSAFVETIFSALPGEVAAFRDVPLWTGSEMRIDDAFYAGLVAVDFSSRVLATETERLLVIRVADPGWSDLGHPSRVFSVLQRGRNPVPAWFHEWQRSRTGAATAAA